MCIKRCAFNSLCVCVYIVSLRLCCVVNVFSTKWHQVSQGTEHKTHITYIHTSAHCVRGKSAIFRSTIQISKLCVIGWAWRLVDSMLLTANLKEHVNFFLILAVWSAIAWVHINFGYHKQSNQRLHLLWMFAYEFCVRLSSRETKHKYYCYLKRGPMTIEHTSISSKRKTKQREERAKERQKESVMAGENAEKSKRLEEKERKKRNKKYIIHTLCLFHTE